MIDNKVGWQVFSTGFTYDFSIIKKCVDAWTPYYDEMFCWVNNTVKKEPWFYDFISEKCTAYLDTVISRPKLAHIKEVPLQLGYNLLKNVGRGMKEPEYVTAFDVDEEVPAHPDFFSYFQEWLKSDSTIMWFNFAYFWGDFNTIRVDKFSTQAPHAKAFKVPIDAEFTWVPYASRGRPLNFKSVNAWKCPYPLLHYNHMLESDRQRRLTFRQRGLQKVEDSKRPSPWQVTPPIIYTCDYDVTMTTNDIGCMQKQIRNGVTPENCKKRLNET